MQYLSTRDSNILCGAQQAIVQGLSRDGGLFTPSLLPAFSLLEIEEMSDMNYQGRALTIMKLFLDDFTVQELILFTDKAYSAEKFDDPAVAPVRHIGDAWFLELWHGPTSAFKDMALQMLPYLLTASLDKTGEKKTACILVATSGDTGKAALEGFRDVPRTKILVFYPKDGVSDIQKLQMTSQEGNNVGVCAVYGNFDDAQTGVKKVFSDSALRDKLADMGVFLSSANSINWGRVMPQIVYYFSAYCDLLKSGAIKNGQSVNFCVPTGNFGNILAAYYAKMMGLPIGRLICASNSNNVLTQFLQTGVYDRNRPFYTTMSPSMDILISSNLERLLYHLSYGNDRLIKAYMEQLAKTGRYEVDSQIKVALSELFSAGFCDEARTRVEIEDYYKNYNYLIDTHTAVAAAVYKDYRKETGDTAPTVIVSTASPFKFCDSVLAALGEPATGSGTELLTALTEKTGVMAPAPLLSLKDKTVRFDKTVEKSDMEAMVLEMLG